LPKASHETLSIILVYGGLASLALLLWIGYMYWRDRKRFGQRKPNVRNRPRSKRKKRYWGDLGFSANCRGLN